MKRNLFVMWLLAGGSRFAETHFSFGAGIGMPGYWATPPPPVVVYAPPPWPGPGYTLIEGYWYPARSHYFWHAGYWARPPYAGGYWVAPRYYEHRYYPGYFGYCEQLWKRDNNDDRWERQHGRHWDHDDEDR